jgi:hypothetical protein
MMITLGTVWRDVRRIQAVIFRLFAAAALALALAGCTRPDAVDEATAAGKTVADFPETRADIFQAMDGGIKLTPAEVAGRNTWMLWTAGNEAFWDDMGRHAYGLVDFLKMIDSRRRPTRFAQGGLINEPGYRQATAPDQFGLYIDQPISPQPDGSNPAVDGKSTGIIGFRLFPNPKFDEAARKKWDGNRYYNDPAYYRDPNLVTPYRVGMTCAACHVSFHPLYPPQDVVAPEWRNLSATIGNQYFRTRGVFGLDLQPSDFLYSVLNAARPGTVETSIIATDNNNNPNIINAIYNVQARLAEAPAEHMGAAAAAYPPGGATRHVPHILVDGADSIGVPGALDRVFVNVGMFGEEWVRCHNPIIGVRRQKPFSIANAQKNSVYWQVTEQRTPNLASYLIAASGPMPLRDAPGGPAYLTADQLTLDRGKIVFAENCLSCHSSKRLDDGIERRPEQWSEWANSPAFLAWARREVMRPDFLDNNYLSSDARYPITLLQTNAARALQDNATRGKIWDEFSSEDYKRTPPIGEIQVYNPFSKRDVGFSPPGGGPGFYRVPTLVSIWNSAPYLHNNALGEYNGDPSVAGRMRAFDSAIDQMFSLEKRHGPESIDRTTETTYFVIAAVYLPYAVEGVVGRIARPFTALWWLLPTVTLLAGIGLVAAGRRRRGRWRRRALLGAGSLVIILGIVLVPLNLFAAGKLGDLKLGPFPKGMPIDLIANMNPAAPPLDTLRAIWEIRAATARIAKGNLSEAEALRVFNEKAAPALWKISKNPDWVEDRGHYFAVMLSNDDKRALKEFLKTL